MICNLDAEILRDALSCVQFASHLASILSQQDNETLVVAALQAAELLSRRLPDIYRYHFYREGVFAEISKLAAKKTERSVLDKEIPGSDDDRKSEDSRDSEERMSSSPASSRSSSSSRHVPTSSTMDRQQWIAERAAIFMTTHDKNESVDMKDKALKIMEDLKALREGLKTSNNPEDLFERLAAYFDNSLNSISSFELLNSHIVEALLAVLRSGPGNPA